MITSHSESTPYRTRFSAAGHEAYSDASETKGGAGAGFGPHALLEGSVACCINIWLRMYADKNEIPLSGVAVDVRLNRESPGATTFEWAVTLEGNLTPEQRNRLLEQVDCCPVSQTLLKEISFREMSALQDF